MSTQTKQRGQKLLLKANSNLHKGQLDPKGQLDQRGQLDDLVWEYKIIVIDFIIL